MTADLTPQVLADIMDHAHQQAPRECCGLVLISHGRQRYHPCQNLARTEIQIRNFVLSPADYAAAQDAGAVVMVVHSHPRNTGPLQASALDLAACEKSGLPWLIVCPQTGATLTLKPPTQTTSLYGRSFVHGQHDCYGFIRAYYQQVLSITLPDIERVQNWWLKGENLYLENAGAAGFTRVQTAHPLPHDVLLMRLASPVPNHAAVYLGDGHIAHHQMGRLSSRDIFSGWYQKITVGVYRHKDAPAC